MKHLILLLLLFICSFAKAQKTNPIQEAIGNYDYETALKLIEKEKTTIPLLFLKGKSQKELGRYREALNTFEEILKTENENVKSLIEAAECCKMLSLNNKAVRYFSIAHTLAPENKYVNLQQIALLFQMEKFYEALNICNEQAKTDSSAIMLRFKAECLKALNLKSESKQLYRIILEKYPEDFLSTAGLAGLYIDLEEYGNAIRCTEQYRLIDSLNISINQKNAQAYCLAQRYPEAIARYEALQARGDSTVQTNYYLGLSYYVSKQYFYARRCLFDILQFNQKNPTLLYYLGMACTRANYPKEGLEYMQKALELTIPTDSTLNSLYRGLAESYKDNKQYKAQIEAMRTAYKYSPKEKKSHVTLYQIALVYQYRLNDVASAQKCLEEFLSTRPKNNKKKQPELVNNTITVDIDSYYNAAEAWIDDIKKGIKPNENNLEAL